MVRDLEQVDGRQVSAKEDGVHPLLDVAREQQSMSSDVAQQDDREVVDLGPAIGRPGRDRSRIRPQDAKSELVDGQPITGRERGSTDVTDDQACPQGRIVRAQADQPGLEHAPDRIAIDQGDEPGDMVGVRVRHDHDVDPPIPGREALVQGDQEPARIRPTVDQETSSPATLNQDRVALAHV